MWIFFAILSAALLGFYDVFKKISLRDNAVLPVLFINTLLCSCFFLPVIIASGMHVFSTDSGWFIPAYGIKEHTFVFIKSLLVLGSWIFGYFAIKYLPLTIVGPINATRPVLTLLGALLLFSEHLNFYQWVGVLLAISSFYLLSRAGKKEGIQFSANKWIWFLIIAAILGTSSGLYDKYLVANIGVNRLFVQAWYNVYQMLMMAVVFFILWIPKRNSSSPFKWKWAIVLISVFLTAADLSYFYALSIPGVMISIVSMVRRGSVLVSFLFGALVFKEKNVKAKALDLFLVLLSMLFLFLGTIYG